MAALVGLGPDEVVDGATAVTRTLEGGVRATLAALDLAPPDLGDGLRSDVERALAGLDPERTLVRGLYSGGTLCYEALTVLEPWLGPVWSNTPLDKRHRVPAPAGSHTCLDLGEEEYTKGRPHPMIDPEARLERLRDLAGEGDVAVVLLDVVLGYGSHPDPAAMLAPACAELAGRTVPASSSTCSAPRATPRASTASAPAFAAAGRHRRADGARGPRWPRRPSLVATRRSSTAPCRDDRVALVTYSTKPRGGVVHTLALAEALGAREHPSRSSHWATRRSASSAESTRPFDSSRRPSRARRWRSGWRRPSTRWPTGSG